MQRGNEGPQAYRAVVRVWDRGALSPSAQEQARARPQGLPVPAARDGNRAAEPGVGDGHHLHPDGVRVRLPEAVRREIVPHLARPAVEHGETRWSEIDLFDNT